MQRFWFAFVFAVAPEVYTSGTPLGTAMGSRMSFLRLVVEGPAWAADVRRLRTASSCVPSMIGLGFRWVRWARLGAFVLFATYCRGTL